MNSIIIGPNQSLVALVVPPKKKGFGCAAKKTKKHSLENVCGAHSLKHGVVCKQSKRKKLCPFEKVGYVNKKEEKTRCIDRQTKHAGQGAVGVS